MGISIRKETPTDHQTVFHLIAQAFEKEELSDHKEQYMVERLRKSEAFIPELSLVAELDSTIAGYILLSKIKIQGENESFDSLALAPVAVLREYHSKGIGELLIVAAHKIASQLGHTSIVLLGHEHYYPRFGYQQAHIFGIELPFDVPKENCMAIELAEGALDKINGTVVYPKAFFE